MCKPFPRLLSCGDHQASRMSPWFTQGCWAEGSCACACPRGAHAWNHTALSPRLQLCSISFVHASPPLTQPSECLLLLQSHSTSKLWSQLLQLFLISTILFAFLQRFFKKIKSPGTVLGTKWTRQTWYLITQSLSMQSEEWEIKQTNKYVLATFSNTILSRGGIGSNSLRLRFQKAFLRK